MRQELSFLDHLLGRSTRSPGDTGVYTAGGIRPAHVPYTATARSALNLQA